MKRPTLSVGMPNFNHGRYLPAALDALLAQADHASEIVVIDDGSTDDSVAIIRGYQRRHAGLRLIVHRSNRGVNATLAELLDRSTGDYFYAPAADDFILPGFLEKSLQLLARHPQAGLCSTQTEIVDEAGVRAGADARNPGGKRGGGYYLAPAECAAVLWKRRSWMLGNTVIFRRQALVDAGGFRLELEIQSDAFAHEVIARRHGVCFVPEILAASRLLPTTYTSRTNRDLALMRRIRDAERALMFGKYRSLFPPAYVHRWSCRWDFGRVRAYSGFKGREWRAGLRQFLLPGTIGERMLYATGAAIILALVAVIQAAALVLLLAFDLGRIMRHDLWQAIRHRRRGLRI